MGLDVEIHVVCTYLPLKNYLRAAIGERARTVLARLKMVKFMIVTNVDLFSLLTAPALLSVIPLSSDVSVFSFVVSDWRRTISRLARVPRRLKSPECSRPSVLPANRFLTAEPASSFRITATLPSLGESRPLHFRRAFIAPGVVSRLPKLQPCVRTTLMRPANWPIPTGVSS